MRQLIILIISSVLSISIVKCYGQEDQCGRKADVYYRSVHTIGIDEPQDATLRNEYRKLSYVDTYIIQHLQKHPALHILPIARNTNIKKHGYRFEGLVSYSPDARDYKLHLMFQATCSENIVAESKVSFQLYPSWDPSHVVEEAMSKLMSRINIEELENKVREIKNYGLGGDVWGGMIEITMDKTMVKGEETQVLLSVVDCDGLSLTGKEINLQASGGIFTPAKIKTNSEGEATARFRLTTDKTAIIKAQCQTKNVWGCDDLYTGTEVIKGIDGHPVKIEIRYVQQETHTVQRATLPGVKIKGGEDTELVEMFHSAVMYHFPSAAALKEGFLVAIAKDNPYPKSKTEHVSETGWFLLSRDIQHAEITAGVGFEVHATEDEEEQSYSGNASIEHPSQLFFFKGEANNPPYFSWTVEYPASNKNIAYGGIEFAKNDNNVQWIVKKITDPKSLYKTEYLLKLHIDAAEELKKGNIAMKQLFGFDVDQMAKIFDPTNPQEGLAGASGLKIVSVRILSPYAD